MDLPDCRNIGRRERCLGFATMATLIVLAFGHLPTVGQAPPVKRAAAVDPPPPAPGPPVVPFDAANVTAPEYGANSKWPQTLGDSAAAIQSALDKNPKGVIFIPPGTYRLSASLRVKRTQTILGNPVGANMQGPTVLNFSPGIDGIVVEDDASTGGGQETRIADLQLWGLYRNIATVPAHGIRANAGFRVERIRASGFNGHGVYISAQTPATRANLWQAHDLQLDNCTGDGFHVEGGDANGGLAVEVSATANKGWGIRDDSSLGNTYMACHTRTNQLGAYSIGAGGPGLSGVNASALFGCYAEADNYRSQLGDQVWWFGGTNATEARGGQLILPGNARARFQSGGGNVPPLSVMGSRLLTGPVLAMQNWAGATTSAFSQDGTLSLGLAPGELVPGQGQAQPPRLSIWGLGEPAIRYGVTKQGYVAHVGDVVASADGNGYGSGYVAHRTVGPGGVLSDAIRLQRGRVTVGQGGLQLPALTKVERARLAPPPKAGMVVWGADESALVVYDGTQWKPLTAGR
jgi:hypothetical protein